MEYKWYLLFLGALTCAVVIAIPFMSLSVLFKEISGELGLNLVQIGLVWGSGSLPAVFTSFFAGALGDRFGSRRILVLGSLLTGLACTLQGFSTNFFSLFVSVGVFGSLTPFVFNNVFKTCGLWFPKQKLGLANGVLAMGMAFGFLLGSMLSATIMSPWLDGWRHVFMFYGLLGVLFSIPWYFSRSAPASILQTNEEMNSKSIRQAMVYVVKIRNVWMLGLTLFGVGGCIAGILGYLPLYLRGLGWPGINADSTLGAFHTTSMVLVLPIAFWSDRIGSRKKMLLGAAVMIMSGAILLSFVDGPAIWGAVIMVGMVRDGFMAVYMTMVLELEEVGPSYAGTATGFAMLVSGTGQLLASTIGNSFASISPGAPFIFWAVMAVLGIFCLILVR